MTLSLEHLARTIAKARHGTDAMWANYMPSARAVAELIGTLHEYDNVNDALLRETDYVRYAPEVFECAIRTLIAQPSGAQ